MSESLFSEMKRYVDFGEADHAHLRALHPRIQPHVHGIVEDFYSVIERHPGLKILHVEADAGWLPYWLRRRCGPCI